MNESTKKTYYLDFITDKLIAGKELLKTMPVFYNRVYFCRKCAMGLWANEGTDLHFNCISLVCKEEDIEKLRQIIKNNSLYISKWDSSKVSDMGDFGFSFIGGNIKFILMPYRETEQGFEIRSYDCENSTCYITNVPFFNKNSFAVRTFNELGEQYGTCDFDLEDMNASNTVSRVIKSTSPQVAVYDNGGFTKGPFILTILVISLTLSWLSYMVLSFITK